ncbi:hypothetical protein [Janthinobacterium lividum]|uniref:hypothetical protein n=1 Tax=Janthinobacterium lividum TaxID=29581 RepID=UPI00111306AA|nr:hypothetical protein [Janthinobacterium lividum]MCC7717401.1 hypothetical protein [Janthinobacterium lividum]WQE31954.1 hypothetical protein U0004_29095 [Janthinobacterium lividum]
MPPFAIVSLRAADCQMLISDASVIDAGDALGEAGFSLKWLAIFALPETFYLLPVYELIAFLNKAIFKPIPIG